MFQSIKIAGHQGQVRWVYLPAVTFGPWSFKGEGRTGTITAQVVSVNEKRIKESPLIAVVPMARSEWTWNVRNLLISGSTITIEVERQ